MKCTFFILHVSSAWNLEHVIHDERKVRNNPLMQRVSNKKYGVDNSWKMKSFLKWTSPPKLFCQVPYSVRTTCLLISSLIFTSWWFPPAAAQSREVTGVYWPIVTGCESGAGLPSLALSMDYKDLLDSSKARFRLQSIDNKQDEGADHFLLLFIKTKLEAVPIHVYVVNDSRLHYHSTSTMLETPYYKGVMVHLFVLNRRLTVQLDDKYSQLQASHPPLQKGAYSLCCRLVY